MYLQYAWQGLRRNFRGWKCTPSFIFKCIFSVFSGDGGGGRNKTTPMLRSVDQKKKNSNLFQQRASSGKNTDKEVREPVWLKNQYRAIFFFERSLFAGAWAQLGSEPRSIQMYSFSLLFLPRRSPFNMSKVTLWLMHCSKINNAQLLLIINFPAVVFWAWPFCFEQLLISLEISE